MFSKVSSVRHHISRNLIRGLPSKRLFGTEPDSSPEVPQDRPKLWNLAPNPSFEQVSGTVALAGMDSPSPTYKQPYDDGGVYIHMNCVAYASDAWAKSGQRSLCIAGINGSNDTFIAPGGSRGALRLNMTPGRTYTAGATVRLDKALEGTLHRNALSIVAVWELNGIATPVEKASDPAPNRPGEADLSVTFTVPKRATAAWIKLVSGASYASGEVWWDSFYVYESPKPGTYFDGSFDDTHDHSYGWHGKAHASPSYRVLTSIPESPQEIERSIKSRISRKEFPEAGYLLDEFLTHNPDSPWGHFARAKVHEQQGRPDLAVACYQKSLQIAPGQPEVHFRLGCLFKTMRRKELAIDELRTAVNLDPHRPNWHYELGSLLDQSAAAEERQTAYKQGISVDPNAPDFGLEMFSDEAQWIPERFRVVKFLQENLPHIQSMVKSDPPESRRMSDNFPIFMYWGQGFAQAPELVRRCAEQLISSGGGTNVHFLDDSNWHYYVDILPVVHRKTEKLKAHFSDILRLALLEKYGGVWMDATCFASTPVSDWIPDVSKAGFFAFTRSGARVCSWMLSSQPHGYIVSMMKAALYLYWEKHDSLIHYFLFHHIFEGLYWLDSEFARLWEQVPSRSADPPHRIARTMLTAFEPATYQALLADSPVHKLKYKYAASEVGSDSYLAHLLRGNALSS